MGNTCRCSAKNVRGTRPSSSTSPVPQESIERLRTPTKEGALKSDHSPVTADSYTNYEQSRSETQPSKEKNAPKPFFEWNANLAASNKDGSFEISHLENVDSDMNCHCIVNIEPSSNPHSDPIPNETTSHTNNNSATHHYFKNEIDTHTGEEQQQQQQQLDSQISPTTSISSSSVLIETKAFLVSERKDGGCRGRKRRRSIDDGGKKNMKKRHPQLDRSGGLWSCVIDGNTVTPMKTIIHPLNHTPILKGSFKNEGGGGGARYNNGNRKITHNKRNRIDENKTQWRTKLVTSQSKKTTVVTMAPCVTTIVSEGMSHLPYPVPASLCPKVMKPPIILSPPLTHDKNNIIFEGSDVQPIELSQVSEQIMKTPPANLGEECTEEVTMVTQFNENAQPLFLDLSQLDDSTLAEGGAAVKAPPATARSLFPSMMLKSNFERPATARPVLSGQPFTTFKDTLANRPQLPQTSSKVENDEMSSDCYDQHIQVPNNNFHLDTSNCGTSSLLQTNANEPLVFRDEFAPIILN